MSAEWPAVREEFGRLHLEVDEPTSPIAEGLYTLAAREKRRRWAKWVLAGLLAILAGALWAGCATVPGPTPARLITLPEREGSVAAKLIGALTGQRPTATTLPGGVIVVFQPAGAHDACLIAHETVHVADQREIGTLAWLVEYQVQLGECEARPGADRGECLRTIPLERGAYRAQHECQARRAAGEPVAGDQREERWAVVVEMLGEGGTTMSDEIRVGDRYEFLAPNGSIDGWPKGSVVTVVSRLSSGDGVGRGPDGKERRCAFSCSRFFTRLPREDAAPKLAVPRMARSFDEMRAGMRVKYAPPAGHERVLAPGRGGGLAGFDDDGRCMVSAISAFWFRDYGPMTILADPEPAAIPRESSPSVLSPADTQALIKKCSAMVAPGFYENEMARYKPCPTHNMPLPCVECSLNASHTEAAFARTALEAHERERERQRAARELRERLVVVRPWAMMGGVQGPGWDRRGGR